MKKNINKLVSKKSTSIILVLVFAVVGTYLLTFSQAAVMDATLTLSPATGSYVNGSDLTVAINVNSNTQQIGTVAARLSYDPTKLTFLDVNNTGSPFDKCFETAGGGGSVDLVCSKFGASTTGPQKVGNVTFRVNAGSGSSAITFKNTSSVLTYSGTPENIWNGNLTGGTYSFTTPDTIPPTVTIQSPANGGQVVGPMPIQATAIDNSGVISKVEFWVNGTRVNTDTQSPYAYTWDSTLLSDRTGVVVLVKAFDNATPTPIEGSSSVTVSIKNNKPNLIVSVPTLSPANPKAGEVVTITSQVRNTGNDNIASTTAISNIFKLNAVNLNSALSLSGLNINTEKPITTTWTATRGSHIITAVADQNGLIPESNESDNQANKSITVYKQADADNDNVVGPLDLAIFSFNYGQPGMTFAQGDFDGDGTIGPLDVAILSFNWGK